MRKLPLMLASLLLLSGCDSAPPSHSIDSTAFGDELVLTIRGTDKALADKAAAVAVEDLHFIAEVSHPWRPGPLGRTNQLLGYEAEFSANPSVLPMIRRATELEQETNGYYAPALGQLQALWGFHSEFPEGVAPDPDEIQKVLTASPTMTDIHIDGIRMRSSNGAVQVDFGPFARGYALDTARQRLAEQGIDEARIDNGPFTVVLGEGWQTRLGNDTLLTLQSDETVVTLTSDAYAFDDSTPYHPYINPHTGHPGKGLARVTVLHPRAADAAALAHALLAGGKGELEHLLATLPLKYALAVTADGERVTTPALSRRLSDAQH